MQDQHKFFQTRDGVLALALLNAGCTPAPQAEGGPCENVYMPADMRSKRLLTMESVEVEQFEAAVALAFEKRKRGIVTWFFVRDKVFLRAIKAWDKMVELFEKAAAEKKQPRIPQIDEITAMQVAYMLRVNGERIKDLPFVRTPICSTLEGDTTEHAVPNRTKGVKEHDAPAARQKTVASGASWTLGMSEEKKRKLGIID